MIFLWLKNESLILRHWIKRSLELMPAIQSCLNISASVCLNSRKNNNSFLLWHLQLTIHSKNQRLQQWPNVWGPVAFITAVVPPQHMISLVWQTLRVHLQQEKPVLDRLPWYNNWSVEGINQANLPHFVCSASYHGKESLAGKEMHTVSLALIVYENPKTSR